MADALIGAAPVGQPGAGLIQGAGTGQQGVQAPAGTVPQAEPNQPQVNYVTSEQLNAAVDRLERLVQSSTDKSYNRVQKMIDQMKQAGIQNPTVEQAQAMLAATGQSEQAEQRQSEAQGGQGSVSAEAAQWIKANGGDPNNAAWSDIYDAAQESGVPMITREDPEYAQFFMENGQVKTFAKTRQFVRAFEQAFEAKKQRLGNGREAGTVPQAVQSPGLASSPALGTGAAKSNYHDPKKTDRSDLVMAGLRQERRR